MPAILVRLLARLRARRRLVPRDEEIAEEIRFHLAEEVRLRSERGLAPAEAERAARRAFGNELRVAEATRDVWGRRMLDDLVRDTRLAWRQLHRSPAFALVTVGTLALAIGASTALFTVVNSVVLRPLPFPDPDRLVMVFEHSPSGRATNSVAPGNFLDWRERSRSFERFALLQQIPMNVIGPDGAEQVAGLLVTGDFFEALGVAPLVGRALRPGEDAPGAPATVVLAHGLWQRRYGGQVDVIGRTVAVNGAPAEVVGVMPPGFGLPGLRAELFTLLTLQRDPTSRGGRSFLTVARLRPEVPLSRAQAEMSGIAARLAEEDPGFDAKWGATVVRLRDHAVGPVRRALLVLQGAVCCVLLIACANIACLLGMRANARAKEMSVRLALGAGRWRLVRQLAVESLLLAGLGGLLGLLLAQAGVPAIVRLFPADDPLPRAEEIGVDRWVLAATAAVSMGAGLLFGLLPGLQAGRGRLAEILRASGRAVTAGSRARSVMVVAEVTLAVVLVVGAGLFVRSLAHLYAIDPGFRAEKVLTARMLLVPAKYAEAPARAAVVDRMLEEVKTIPGVSAAGSIHFLPLSGAESGTGAHRADRPAPAPGEGTGTSVSVITAGYLRTMSIPVVAGRDFEARDGMQAPRVALVNQALAARFYPGEDPLGKKLYVEWCDAGEDCRYDIVGVVADSRHAAVHTAPAATVFLNNAQVPSYIASLVVRTTGAPLSVAGAVRERIGRVDREQGLTALEPMEAVLADAVARPRLQALLLSAFAALALVMACLGLYGVLAYAVEQRRREVGVRVAIGASPAQILRQVLGEGMRLTALGVVLGMGAALALTRSLTALLFGVGPTDPGVYLGVGALLLAVAAGAAFAPARRAMRVDPVAALRED